MSGTYNVPTTFTSIAAAIADLTIYGVSGPVTINVSAGYAETAPLGGYTFLNIAGSSSVNTINFQKSGLGANPIVTAYTGTSTSAGAVQDGVWRIIGQDFLTIDGLDINDPNITNPAAMEFGYGFFKENANNGCQNNIIRNCVITMNRVNNALGSGPSVEGSKAIVMVNATAGAHVTALTISNISGVNSNNRFYSNTLQNCNVGISIAGFAGASPFTFCDSGNDIGGNSALTGNTITNFGGGGTNPAYGVNTSAQYNLNVSFNTLNSNNGSGTNHNGVLRGIYLNTAISANATVNTNTITIHGGGTTSLVFGIHNLAGSTAAGNSVNINNNVLRNSTYTTATTGVFNAILNSATPSTLTMNGNSVTNYTLNGTGTHVMLSLGSPSIAFMNSNTVNNISLGGISGTTRLIAWASPQAISVNNNLVSNISYTNLTSTGAVDCLSGTSSALNVTITGNQVFNVFVPTTGIINGIRESGSSLGIKTITGNQVYNLVTTPGASGGGGRNGIFCSTGTVNISNNTLYSLQSIGTTGGTGGIIYGIQLSAGTFADISRNKIYDLSSNASGPTVGGIVIGGSNCNVFNNLVGGITTPSANAANPLLGISVTGGTSHNIAYNTVNLSGSSSGAVFGSSAFNLSSTTSTVNVNNNIFVNNSIPNGTGLTVAFRRSSAVFTNYGANSNNNLFFAGTPTASNVVHFDGTTSYQSLANYKTIASPRDGASVTENPPFISLIGSNANYLNINPALATQVESGGSPLAAVNLDFVGSVRNPTFPDLGAWEGNFTLPVVNTIPPNILGQGFTSPACNIASRTFTVNFSSISGVASGPLSPLVYYRINLGTYSSTPGALTSGSSTLGVLSFTLTYPATLNDVISYYIVAQDLAATPNLMASPGAGFAGTDVNNVTTPPTIPNSYVVGNSLSGVYTVGSAGTYTSLTAASIAYNTSCLTGPVTFSLADALYGSNETFPITFSNNIFANATNSLLIRPASGVSVSITGTNTAATSVLKFFNARFITVDGLNTGGSALTINNPNTSSGSANIWLASSNTAGSGNNFIAVSNLALNGGNIGFSNGIIAGIDGPAPTGVGGQDNDNISVNSNTFLTFFNGILAVGTTPTSLGGIDNWVITNNLIGPVASGTNIIGGSGMVISNALNLAATSNTVRNIFTASSSIYGINVNSNVNGFNVSNNILTNLTSGAAAGGVAAIAGLFMGSSVINGTVSTNQISVITNTSPSGYGARGLIVNTGIATSNISIRNNFISGISSVADGSPNWSPIGIEIQNVSGGIDIDYNSVSLSGSFAGLNVASISAPLWIGSGGGNLRVRNNIFSNTYDNITSTTDLCYGIYSAVPNSNFSVINYNNYFVGGSNNVQVLGFLGTNQNNLTGIQSVFGQNLNSVSLLPTFTSATDLHLPASAPANFLLDNLGLPLSGIVTDIDNQSRSATVPDIGADEFTSTAVCSSANGGSISVSSLSVCSNQTLALSSASVSAGLGTVYQWQVSSTPGGPYLNVTGGSGSNSIDYSTNSLAAGTFYYVLRAACASFTAVSNEATVSINAAPNPVVASSPTIICNSGNATLTASGAVTYTWNTGATTSSIVITPTSSANYNVIGGNIACANVVSSNVSLFFSLSPTVSALTSTPSVCDGIPVNLSASGANTYSWSNAATGASISPTPSVNTVYTVTGFKTDGCSATATLSVLVNPKPNVTISGSSGLCTGQTATLVASGASTYSWNTSALTNSITDSPVSSTTYTVIGTDALGCSTTTTQLVTVAGSLSISITGPSAICVGQTPTLSANGGVTYTWNTNATSANISPSPTLGVNNYSVIGASGTCSNSGLFVLTVNPNPIVSVSGTTVVCAGRTTTLTASGALTYTWNPSPVSASTAVSPSVNTTYSVIGTSSLGCSTSATVAVVSNTLPLISIAQSATAVCLFSSATFTASGANTYTWTGGPTNAFNTVTPTASSLYTVGGTNAAGCISTTTVAVTSLTLPIISITPATATVCSLSSIGLTASGASTYTWSGTSVPGAAASYTPALSTTYTVTGTNAQNCISTATVGVVTNTLPVMLISPPSATVCSLGVASFTASGASSYVWNGTNSGAAFVSSVPNNITHTVTGTSTQGCAASATVAVSTLSLPPIAVTPSLVTVCILSTSNYTASGAVTYTWSNSTNATTIALTPTATTAYLVSGTGANGCISSSQVFLLTNPLPTLSVLPLSATVCPNTSATFTAFGANTYTWSNGPLTTTALITPPSSGIYTVTGSDLNGCEGTKTISIVTNTVPVLSISPSSDSVCITASGSFSVSGATSYTWSTGITGSVINPAPAVTTVYSVTGKNTAGCVSSATVNLHIWQLPVISITPASATICAKESITFTAAGAASYTWFPFNANSATLTNAPSNSSIYSVNGVDVNGCFNSGTVVINVKNCTGISQNTSSSSLITLYPNPSTGLITAKFQFEGQKNILITNSVGALVEELTTENQTEIFNLSDKAKGIYFVKVTSKIASANYRIIIQ